jgi:RES domain-containing protein
LGLCGESDQPGAERSRRPTCPRRATSAFSARIHGGRWNTPSSFATLYLALDRDTVVAEFERAAQRQGLTTDQFLPRELHEFEARLSAVLDLTAGEARQRLGLAEADLGSDDPPGAVRSVRPRITSASKAVMAPSAAGRGVVLAVFLAKLQPGSAIEALRHEVWERP